MAHRSTLAERREVWGSSETDPPGSSVGATDLVIVHHFYRPDVAADAPVSAERRAMRSVEDYHTEGHHEWDDIGYAFVIFDSGRAYEGRGWGHSGAHTKGMNFESVGIAFAIDGNQADASPAAYAKARELLREGVEHGYLSPAYSVDGHRDYQNKDCPGHKVYPRIEEELGSHRLQEEPSDDEEVEVNKEDIKEAVREVLNEHAHAHARNQINDTMHRVREVKRLLTEGDAKVKFVVVEQEGEG